MKKKIPIGSDHAGFEMKQFVINYLKEQGYEIQDCGTHSDESTDYPEFGHKVAAEVE